MNIDAQEMARSLTGFDELAIRQYFKASFQDLEGTMGGRSLYFVQLRRDGSTDAAAFNISMEVTVGVLNVMFGTAEDEDAEGESLGSTTMIAPTNSIEPSVISSSAQV